MRLFKREKSAGSPCPRCSQIVADDVNACPMCGWDVREAYQGPSASQLSPATAMTGAADPSDKDPAA
jgi:hypothetical protein